MTSIWTRALVAVAARWTDPDHPPRAAATAATLEAPNAFTEESVAFDVNVTADLLAEGRLGDWLAERVAPGGHRDRAVGVVSGGRTPTEGLLELAAVAQLGFEAIGHLPAASPRLSQAFFEEVASEAGEVRVRFVDRRRLFSAADAVLGAATREEREAWGREADEQGIPGELRLWMPVGWGVAVLDGRESRADLSGLAEDALLHEGGSPRSVRLLWAPEGLSPDPLLDVLASFREEYPPHATTDGTLKMPAAFLEAARRPVAVGPGFLLSKGDPEPQDGAHLRWAEYGALGDVAAWIAEQREHVSFVVAGPAAGEGLRAAGLPAELPLLSFGDAHRTDPGRYPLSEPLASFLASL